VTADTAANQREIADDVKDLVPHEFVCKTQRFLA